LCTGKLENSDFFKIQCTNHFSHPLNLAFEFFPRISLRNFESQRHFNTQKKLQLVQKRVASVLP
jgi:hypothetical protein